MWFTRRDLLRAGLVLPIGAVASEEVADASAVVAAAVAGVRNVGADTPVGLSDQFHIGTVTRAMTSTLLAMLIQDKRLTWATPLEQFLPDLAKSMHEAYRRIPLSFVAHETTGLEDNAVKGLDYGSKGDSLADLRTLWLQEALRQAPAFPPGTKHEYRNINYVIAGAIVDRLSGRETWESCIRTKLFAPLEITSAGYGPMGVPGEDLQPSGHTREKGVLRPVWGDVAPSTAPAGSLHMSVSDPGAVCSTAFERRAGACQSAERCSVSRPAQAAQWLRQGLGSRSA